MDCVLSDILCLIIIVSYFFPQTLCYAHSSLRSEIMFPVWLRFGLLEINVLACLCHGNFFSFSFNCSR